ncbi:MAG: CinA family protein [Alphaproteobacteria bacterium]|nr:CinA family protein [Alphaproteobacteria bacterium]
MFPDELVMTARLLLADAEERRLRFTTAESCTGGLVAALFTDIPGSSSVYERGFVTYSNRAKEEMLGVPGDLIADCGAVSEPVARAMAEGALRESHAHISVAITGVAGPGGGSSLKPVGLVHLAAARENRALVHVACRFGDIGRGPIRMAAVETALGLLRQMMD